MLDQVVELDHGVRRRLARDGCLEQSLREQIGVPPDRRGRPRVAVERQAVVRRRSFSRSIAPSRCPTKAAYTPSRREQEVSFWSTSAK